MKKYKLTTGKIIEGIIINTYSESALSVLWKNWPALERRYLDAVTFALTHEYSCIVAISCHSGQLHWDVANKSVGTNTYKKQHEIQAE